MDTANSTPLSLTNGLIRLRRAFHGSDGKLERRVEKDGSVGSGHVVERQYFPCSK